MDDTDRCRTAARQPPITERELRLLREMVGQGLTLRQIAALFRIVRRLFLRKRLAKSSFRLELG